MIDRKRGWAAMAVLALLLLSACGDADAEPGLTAAEVREIVRAELAEAPAPPQPGTGVTSAEAERIARGVVASIPLKSAPADYTAFVRGERHRPLRDPGPGRHPGPLQPEGEHRRPVVRLHHRRRRPHSRPSRPPAGGAGREWLGGHRHQRLQLRPRAAVGHRGGQVGDLRVRQPGERGLRFRLHRRVRA